ncbi:hypothetical protein GCM10017788_28840 [Amycolatopsis acidiphila]|nr:hypothetical protein GCM10017788_28840 [Amycolatopsis acidiphila]
MSDATETARSGEAGFPPIDGVAQRPTDPATVVRTVTVIMGVVVALTFMFGFGNVLNLALRLGVPAWVAPLVAPAVDLSIVGLLLGTRHLALTGASPEVLRPACRLLIFASVVTLALNVAEPLVAGRVWQGGVRRGRAAPVDRLVGDRPRPLACDGRHESCACRTRARSV